VYCSRDSSPIITNCIVWDNLGDSVYAGGDSSLIITYSCIEGEPVWTGEGNINQDPLFCGGWELQEVWVDPSGTGAGDGSKANPLSDPRQATMGYSNSLALSATSPCLGTGKNGSDMGADTGRCDRPRSASRTVHLGADAPKHTWLLQLGQVAAAGQVSVS
jgi:hypothetical protein